MLRTIRKYKILYLFGILLLGISIIWNLNQTIQLAYFTPKVVPVKNAYAIPTEINIDKVNLHLSVEETAINNGAWQIGKNGASHLTISARPGERGAIIIYAHNTNNRFGPIRWLSVGDKIEIETGDGRIHNYIVEKTFDASPGDMDIFTGVNTESLILYTCDGFADLRRFVLIGRPE